MGHLATVKAWPWPRILCHLLIATPLLYGLLLALRSASGDIDALGADPAETLMSYLGEWGIRGLIITLFISPLNRFMPTLRLIRYRRLFGLWAFAYVCMHLFLYAIVITGLDIRTLVEDLFERPFIILGMLGFLLLLPLAITSTRGWQKRLGRKWRQLHRLVYIAILIGLTHFFLQVRSDYLEFVLTALIVAGLLFFRVYIWRKQARPADNN